MAIALDNATGNSQAAATSLTFAHTCSGTNRLLFVGFMTARSTNTSVTYNGVAMSDVGGGGLAVDGGGAWLYLYALEAPATGSNNVVITPGASVFIRAGAVSYTGAQQSVVMDSSARSTGSGSSAAYTTTVVGSGCWLFLVARSDSGSDLAAGSGTVARMTANDANNELMDSNGTVGTGAQSLNTTQTSGGYGGIVVSFAPAVTTSIKTINGLANASVKTANGLARASVKSWNGLS